MFYYHTIERYNDKQGRTSGTTCLFNVTSQSIAVHRDLKMYALANILLFGRTRARISQELESRSRSGWKTEQASEQLGSVMRVRKNLQNNAAVLFFFTFWKRCES